MSEHFRRRESSASTSSGGASLARTSARLDSNPASKGAAADSGLSLQRCFEFSGPLSPSSKTAENCPSEDSTSSSGILPSSGMMRNGIVLPLPTSAHRTSGEGFLLWPTPTASDAIRARLPLYSLAKMYWRKKAGHRKNHHGSSILGETLAARFGLRQAPGFTEWMMGVPPEWTNVDCSHWETPLFHRSPNGSVKRFSSIRKRYG